jgi:hypothetical protein
VLSGRSSIITVVTGGNETKARSSNISNISPRMKTHGDDGDEFSSSESLQLPRRPRPRLKGRMKRKHHLYNRVQEYAHITGPQPTPAEEKRQLKKTTNFTRSRINLDLRWVGGMSGKK